MEKYAILLVAILAAALIVVLVDSYHEKKRWRDSALINARKRLQKDQERERQVGLINQNAAKNIARLNAVVEDLQADNLRLKKINEVYRKQIERKEEKAGGGESDG